MVQNDIHRLHVLLLGAGKIKDALWFSLESLCAVVQGCSRKLFFACSGNGNGSSWNNRGSNGNYWSASFNSARNARNLNFNSGGVNPQNNNNRYNGFAVRPVQHTILAILFLLIYGTDTSAAITRPVSGILRCEETQIETLLCQGVGKELEAEHGGLMRRSVLQTLQAFAVEMLHRGLSQEEGDIRCRVQGPYSTSPVLQLYTWPVRENIYPRHLLMYKGSWHSLRYRPNHGLLQEGKSQLAKAVLCDAPRHQRLFHAHREKETSGDRYFESEEDVYSQDKQRQSGDMGRGLGYGSADMAYGSDSHAESERELHHLWLERGLDRLRSCKVDAESGKRPWPAHRQLDKPAILECVSERVRPVHEESAEMSVLWQICGRCSCDQFGQRLATELSAEDKAVHERRVRLGSAHGQAGDLGSASWRGISRCLYQALQDIYLESCSGEDEREDCGVRFLEAEENPEKRQLVLGNIQACICIQPLPQAPYDKGDSENRHIQSRYDQTYRQVFIL